MKPTLIVIVGVFSIFLTSCSKKHSPSKAGDKIINERGTIQQLSANQQWYIIAPDFDPTTRFLPSNLPDEFKRDGIRIIFSGEIGEIPPNVRLIGTPLHLKAIKQIE
jgi:hypothetical protein